MNPFNLITLLTDFGTTEGYVAQMKGVILQRNSRITIVDISHNVQPHNIMMGAFILETSVPFFPKRSIHVAVVDPAVGGRRLPIIIECDNGFLVGPDNGILDRASKRLGFKAAYRIEENLIANEVSNTFHGRDIFAVTAARISKGEKPRDIGTSLKKIVRLKFPEAQLSPNLISTVVLNIDRFGNMITNLPSISKLDHEEYYIKKQKRRTLVTMVKSYSEIPYGKIGILKGSQGYYEIAMREKDAAKMLKVKPLDRVYLMSSQSYRFQKYHAASRPHQSS